VVGDLTIAFNVPYCSSKHALESMISGLRMELAHWGIPVISVQPGKVITQFHSTMAKTKDSNIAETKESGVDPLLLDHYKYLITKPRHNPLSSGALSEAVALKIHSALYDSRPLIRYFAGFDATLLCTLVHLIPDFVQDKFLGMRK